MNWTRRDDVNAVALVICFIIVMFVLSLDGIH